MQWLTRSRWGAPALGAAAVAVLAFLLIRNGDSDRERVELAPGRQVADSVPVKSATPDVAASGPSIIGPSNPTISRWPIDPAKVRLDQLLSDAAKSPEDYDRWVAMRIAAICVALPGQAVSEESVNVSVGGTQERKHAVAAAAREAHARLQQFCGTGDAAKYLKAVRDKRLSLGTIGPSSRATTSSSMSDRLQWFPVVLGSPQRYAASAELWIEEVASRSLPPRLQGNPDASSFITETLSARLLGGAASSSVTALSRCALQLQCPGLSGLNAQEQEAAEAVVDQILDDTRHQRWQALSAH